MLWGAFAGLALLVASGVVATVVVLQAVKGQEHLMFQESAPLLDAVRQMDRSTELMVSSARGYLLTQQTQFLQQYDDAVRGADRSYSAATRLATEPRDGTRIAQFRRHYVDLKGLTDRQIELAREGEGAYALEVMLETARISRLTPDYAGAIADEHRQRQAETFDEVSSARQAFILVMVVGGILIVIAGALAVARIEAAVLDSISRQVRRTEAIIAGMSDGVMLVDGDGKVVFVNPAARRLLGSSATGVPINDQAEVYRFRDPHGRPLAEHELPAARALSSGRPVHDATVLIERPDERVAVSMNATPLQEDGGTNGVIVTFRDITERRRLEEEMHAQAERAQILADAGAFFTSNIDPAWVTQAIAERVAEILGDWTAVVLKTPDSAELQVASIFNRDMASLGLASSYIERQPLTIGEGVIGQVVATGYPSLTAGSTIEPVNPEDGGTNDAAPMQLASLLVLPLRTRREMLGALVIAANDHERAMTDEKLPLAELLAERASLAIENARLYTEQVDARRKMEDLSRLKDEFLSIASHELRTPVTSIKGYTQLAKTLIKEGDLDTSEEYLDIALDQIDRMARLILELLDVSRIETGRLEIRREEIEWPQFVGEVVQRHRAAVSERSFHVNGPNGRRTVIGDRDRLEQVLGNLVENAVKYSPDGSDITIAVDDRGGQVVTSVTDRGIGIPADEMSQVFERFHRGRHVSSTNFGGLGLGLYITKQIVERHGGSIWVESREGSGTTFFFSLPAERGAEAGGTETKSAARP
ncbi:MAG: ATP-binding protein [Thermoanaerobaculia bacterium]